MNDENTSNSANGPDSSRASTQRTVDLDAFSTRSIDREALAEYTARRNARPDEPEKEEDGSLALTNKYLWNLIQTDKRLYYRCPELNEKLYLHYKGFHNIKNLEQFTDLKCLYFEGNGCKSLKGLETNTKLRCLFIQENIIAEMEGLDTLTDLR
jgi:Leucine-rich repeat (LRR) protein